MTKKIMCPALSLENMIENLHWGSEKCNDSSGKYILKINKSVPSVGLNENGVEGGKVMKD